VLRAKAIAIIGVMVKVIANIKVKKKVVKVINSVVIK